MSISKLAGLAVVPLATAALAAPAQAERPFESGRYDDSFTFDSGACARAWDVTFHATGHYQLRATEEGAPDVLVHDNGEWSSVYVAQDNGDSFRLDGHSNFKIRSVERVEGNLWRLDLTDSGRNWVIRSASGEVVWADRGILYQTVYVDTMGDDDPDNDVFESEYDWHGPHFISDSQPGSQFCEYVDQAIALG